jgi:hypothetical protein
VDAHYAWVVLRVRRAFHVPGVSEVKNTFAQYVIAKRK